MHFNHFNKIYIVLLKTTVQENVNELTETQNNVQHVTFIIPKLHYWKTT